MRKAEKILRAIFFLLPFFILSSGNALANPLIDDEEAPDVTARVARVSFLRGSAQIKHIGEADWERVTQNLPIVEGDEISTDGNARLEIQFNRDNYLRLSENAYLKIVTLRDEDIAVSLPEGKLSLRALNFNRERSSFEIDAPHTTVAVQQSGMYRIDAGEKNDQQIRVSVTDGGEARVYSETSGFTLRSGRSAQIQIGGNYAGEWETADAAKYADEFDTWALQRDATVAKLLQNAYYDKYYDSDVYGAEDLSEYGEWIYTRKYGYVWKPYRNATSSYADWSPYRYGNWRWVPPYGWTWVNDEPWGWATYHHGRWVYADNDWVWTPYGYERTRRNRWRPALVVVTFSGSLICWYPLPYNRNYYNYNSIYIDRRRSNTTIVNNTTIINQASSTAAGRRERTFDRKPFEFEVPPVGVVGVQASEFGKGIRSIRPAPTESAKIAVSRTPFENENQPALPTYRQLKGKISREILAESPQNEQIAVRVKTGATERTGGVPVDENLRKERIYGNRAPIQRTPRVEENRESQSAPTTRETGAVKRTPRSVPLQNNNAENVKPSTENTSDDFPARSRGRKTESDDRTVSKPRNKDRELSSPVYAPPEQPAERQERKEPRRISPAPEPPQRSEPAPKREEPRQAKPPQQEQPKSKEERKASPAPIEKPDKGKREKDG